MCMSCHLYDTLLSSSKSLCTSSHCARCSDMLSKQLQQLFSFRATTVPYTVPYSNAEGGKARSREQQVAMMHNTQNRSHEQTSSQLHGISPASKHFTLQHSLFSSLMTIIDPWRCIHYAQGVSHMSETIARSSAHWPALLRMLCRLYRRYLYT